MWNSFDTDKKFLWNKFCNPKLASDSGMPYSVLLNELEKLEAEVHDLPRPVAKAKLFEYVADHIQIDVNPCDFFVGFGCYRRADEPNGWPLVRACRQWGMDIGSRLEHREEIRCGNTTGRFSAWMDFDHSVPMWEVALELGFSGLLQRAEKYRAIHESRKTLTDDARAFFDGIAISYRAILRMLDRFHDYASDHANGHPRMLFTADCLTALRDGAPRNFYEALQFIYLYFMFCEHIDRMQVRSLGNLDQNLYSFFERDLRENRFTEAQMRELLDYFFMQWGSINNYWGQPAWLGGTAGDGSSTVNRLSYIILEELDKLRLPTPKFQLKISPATPRQFLNCALGMIRDWNASLVFICEPGYQRAIMGEGFTVEDARTYDVSGCYEFLVHGKQNRTIPGYLNLLKAVELAMNNGCDPATGLEVGPITGEAETFLTFDDFYAACLRQIADAIETIIRGINDFEPYLAEVNPANVLSATNEYSLQTAKDAFATGCKVNTTGIFLIGMGTVTDALAAVRKYVYERRELTLAEFRDILKHNWKGMEKLRLRILNDPDKYGNGIVKVDSLLDSLARFTAARINGCPNRRGGFYEASVHSAKHYITLGLKTGATPDGRYAGEEISKNLSPAIGMDRNGVTALIRSMTMVDSAQFPADFPLDVMLHPTSVQGEDGLAAMRAVVETYMARNGMSIQFNIFSAEQLRDAQEHPEQYGNLQVRVCGWNVRFNDMDKKEQEAYIERATHIGG